ncbi:unnamed protein product [Auanema sp. JU1783]|nr:unnamed protein product [Auanema sp. JU1783]
MVNSNSKANPTSISFRRVASLKAVNHWLFNCSQHLLIIAPPHCGKTVLCKQLQNEAECVAAHYCQRELAQSTESATLVRSIAMQLVKRFPNLVMPNLSTVTLLSDYAAGLQQYLTLPLASLPQPSKPMFILVDDIQVHSYAIILELLNCLPTWLRLVVTSRPILPGEQFRFKEFHQLLIGDNADELHRFIEVRLPSCNSEDVLDACQGSWSYVDQLGRAVDRNLIAADHIPSTSKDLMDDITNALPVRLPVYIMLIKTSRLPPTNELLLAVSQLVINDSLVIIEREINEISMIFESREPIRLSGTWQEYPDDPLAVYHGAWAELYKTKLRKKPQDIIELAYHLAHSHIPPLEAIRTLISVGADDIILKCSVIDIPTSMLLMKAGTTILDLSTKDDFVFLCSSDDLEKVQKIIMETPDAELASGLLAASSRGHIRIVETILKCCPKIINCISSYGQWNALRSAACNNHLDILNLLLSEGINVNECGFGGRTALRAAAWAGHVEIVDRLLSTGANVHSRDSEQRTALMAAAFMDHTKVLDCLFKYGAQVNDTDSAGATALHLVLSNGSNSEDHQKTVDVLLTHGSDVNKADAHGRTCLHLAGFHGDDNLEKILKLTTNIDSADSLGRTAFMLAASQGKDTAVSTLFQNGADMDFIDSHGRTALQLAAAGGHLNVVDLLLSLGADEAHKDNDGAVALHYAVQQEDTALCRALATSCTISEIDRLGQHPLICAVQHNNEKVLNELLQLGAPVNKHTVDGQTALRVACLNGNVRIVQALSSWVTDWEQKDLDGTPLSHSLLINGQTSMAELLFSLGAQHSATDAHQRACAHVACSINDLAAVRMLRRLGASFEVEDSGGRTPLMTAVWAGHSAVVAYLLDSLTVNPNCIDEQGASPLSIAAQLGYRDMVILLLRFGAEPSLRDHMGRTALDVAKISGHEHIISILKTASGSADSSGFGSMPNSPLDTKSLGRKSFRRSQKISLTSPRRSRRIF